MRARETMGGAAAVAEVRRVTASGAGAAGVRVAGRVRWLARRRRWVC